MRTLLVTLILLIQVAPTWAATLFWDYGGATVSGTVTIMRATTPAGPFALVATVPTSPMSYSLTPGAWGVYRIDKDGKPLTNVVTYAADVKSSPLIDAASQNIASKLLTPDQMEVTGLNCPGGLKTTGKQESLRRVIVCVH